MKEDRFIDPEELGVEWPFQTMAGAVHDIISRFGDRAFTIAHIEKVMETYPDYKRMRGQAGFHGAVRNYLWRQAMAGKIEVIGKYRHAKNRAYRRVKNGD